MQAGRVSDPIGQLRDICLALPEAFEKNSHGEPCFFVQLTPKTSKQFVSLDDHHHCAEHLAFWCPAAPGAQQELIAENPEQFFLPPYVGHRGWIGVRIDLDPDWAEIAELVKDAYRQVATPRLAQRRPTTGQDGRTDQVT